MNLPHYRVRAATATRYLFFTGKGGVGKTSLACATALKLAEAGKRVLLASTDPASNLDEVLEITLSNKSTAVPGVAGLLALNINPAEAAAAYRERVVGPMRGLLPEAALRRMEEQLSGSCTVEPAAFDEFSGLIGDKNAGRRWITSSSIPLPPGTCCCWMRAKPTTASGSGRRAGRSPSPCCACSNACVIRRSRASGSSRCPRRHQCMKRPTCRRTCAAPTSNRSPGSSAKPVAERLMRSAAATARGGRTPLSVRSGRAACHPRGLAALAGGGTHRSRRAGPAGRFQPRTRGLPHMTCPQNTLMQLHRPANSTVGFHPIAHA